MPLDKSTRDLFVEKNSVPVATGNKVVDAYRTTNLLLQEILAELKTLNSLLSNKNNG